MTADSRDPGLRVPTLALACALVALPGAGTLAANNAEQVVFSGVGAPPTSSEPFGFRVWCQAEPASEHGHYDTDCSGSMYFYARGIRAHVTGEVSEPEEGIYQMELIAPAYRLTCELGNVPPTRNGPNNTVLGECTIAGASVTGLMSTDAVVKVTGPDED